MIPNITPKPSSPPLQNALYIYEVIQTTIPEKQNTNPEVFKYSSITEPKDTLECLHNGAPTAQDNPVKDTHLYREKRMRQRINTAEL